MCSRNGGRGRRGHRRGYQNHVSQQYEGYTNDDYIQTPQYSNAGSYVEGRGEKGVRRGGGRPPGLRGAAIGLYFAQRGREKQKRLRTVAHIPREDLDQLQETLYQLRREKVCPIMHLKHCFYFTHGEENGWTPTFTLQFYVLFYKFFSATFNKTYLNSV